MSTLFRELAEVNPDADRLLAASETRRITPGHSEQSDSFGDASFLIVEDGFVVIRTDICREARRRPLPRRSRRVAPGAAPGETLDALVDARITLVSEPVYGALLSYPEVAAVCPTP